MYQLMGMFSEASLVRQLLSAEGLVPPTNGYGPRVGARVAEIAGIQGTSRRLIQDLCHSVVSDPDG